MFLARISRNAQRVGTTGRLPQMLTGCQQRYESSAPPRVEKTMNQVTLLGRVGGDPQKRGNEQHPLVVFSLATHANYQYNSGDTLQKTDWHRVCVFKPYLRETVYKFLTKGQRVLVQGRITYGEVKDQNGVTHATTSIVADDVTFFSSNKMPTESYPEDEEAMG